MGSVAGGNDNVSVVAFGNVREDVKCRIVCIVQDYEPVLDLGCQPLKRVFKRFGAISTTEGADEGLEIGPEACFRARIEEIDSSICVSKCT